VTVYGLGSVLSGGGGCPSRTRRPAWTEMVDGFQREALAGRLRIRSSTGWTRSTATATWPAPPSSRTRIGSGRPHDPYLMEADRPSVARRDRGDRIRWNSPGGRRTPRRALGKDLRGLRRGPRPEASSGPAFVTGLQGDDLTDPTSVLATPSTSSATARPCGHIDAGGLLHRPGVAPADECTSGMCSSALPGGLRRRCRSGDGVLLVVG